MPRILLVDPVCATGIRAAGASGSGLVNQQQNSAALDSARNSIEQRRSILRRPARIWLDLVEVVIRLDQQHRIESPIAALQALHNLFCESLFTTSISLVTQTSAAVVIERTASHWFRYAGLRTRAGIDARIREVRWQSADPRASDVLQEPAAQRARDPVVWATAREPSHADGSRVPSSSL